MNPYALIFAVVLTAILVIGNIVMDPPEGQITQPEDSDPRFRHMSDG